MPKAQKQNEKEILAKIQDLIRRAPIDWTSIARTRIYHRMKIPNIFAPIKC
jgi:hypothetical protein